MIKFCICFSRYQNFTSDGCNTNNTDTFLCTRPVNTERATGRLVFWGEVSQGSKLLVERTSFSKRKTKQRARILVLVCLILLDKVVQRPSYRINISLNYI